MTFKKSFLYTLIVLLTYCLQAQTDLMHKTFFNTNQYILTQTEALKLDVFLQNLPKENVRDVTIYGYCDDRGSKEYNMHLSQKRANTIKNIVMGYGIEDVVIANTDGKGEVLLSQQGSLSQAAQRKRNRKVELIVALNPLDSLPQPPVSVAKERVQNNYKTFKDDIMKGDKILLENILFRTNYSYVKGSSYKDLRELAAFLKEHDNLFFKIQGHVCCINRGRDAVDLRTGKRNLSVMRAKFIYDYLAQLGIEKKRMRYEGFGSRYPLGGKIKYDKRVEILITYVKKKGKIKP